MLTLQDLAQLDRDNRDALVLSAYLTRVDPDPALRSARLTRLEADVSRIAHSLGSAPRAERRRGWRRDQGCTITTSVRVGQPTTPGSRGCSRGGPSVSRFRGAAHAVSLISVH